MLISLSIHNIVLIERLEIAFQVGLCALTGETGAGKSILLDSMGLALGGRSEVRLVRRGAQQAHVTAVFEPAANHPCAAILQEADITFEPGEQLILRRSLGADGRSKAFINDQSVSVGLLREVGDSLVEIHGQFETQGLLNAAMHRLMLDDYAGVDNGLAAQWNGWRKTEDELKRLRAESAQAREQEEYLRQSIEDLDSLLPEVGEEIELAALRERLMSREQVLEGLNAAYHALSGDEDQVRKAWGAIDRVADKLGAAGAEITATLQRATHEAEEALHAIQAASSDLQDTEHSLESIDDRLFGLRVQARKHGCEVDDLPALRAELATKLNMIEHADEALADAMTAVKKARAYYIEGAQMVRVMRQTAGEKLDKLVGQELGPLKLEKARFVTSVEPLEEPEWGPAGMDRVCFLVATNPGAEPGPLNKIASGGEMARFMLALKVVMAEVGMAGTLVFDEVDAGLGGGAADAVGERLAKLGTSRQVLVVTHAPQVAARAGHHYIVRKDGGAEIKTSIVELESPQERREEIARMLAGASVTDEARAAAERLLETGS